MKYLTRMIVASAAFGMLTAGCAVDSGGELDSDLGTEQSGLTALSQDGRYIVKFKNERGRAALHQAAGAQIALELNKRNAVAAYLPEAALNGLRNNPNIEYVEVDPRRYLQATTDPYGLGLVQADQVQADGTNPVQATKTVCVIDSGIKADHPEFAGLPLSGVPAVSTQVDGCGHGTHVAGTVAGATVGVAPDAVGILAVQVFTGADCAFTFASGLVGALDECEAAGADITSMSLGGSFKSRTEDQAFQQAFDRGMLHIAAAGNDGNTRESFPASYDSVVSVAALDVNKALAAFSQQNSAVELAAPGVGVRSTFPQEHSLAVAGDKFQGGHIDLAPLVNASGTLVDGGLCDSVGNFSGAVVMCERGAISFFEKVANAEAGGAVAAVIYNNVPGGFAGTLGDGNSSGIPAISLTQEEGQLIVASHLGANGDVNSGEGDGFALLDGTSMATPHVSGVAGAIWARVPDATNVEVRNAMNATAEDLGAAGRDNGFGFGLVQAQAALEFLAAGGGGECAPAGTSCSSGSECCSGTCSGKGKNKSCQ